MSEVRQRHRVHVVLPAYNEEALLKSLIERIDEVLFEAQRAYEIIVVDDGSTDATADIARECAQRMPVRLLSHDANQGLGATIRDGLFDAAERAGARDVIITMDADATHMPGLILRMDRMIGEGYDVVIASRYQPGARVMGVSALRRFMSYGASWLFRLALPIPGVRDFTCGYRAYRAEAVQQAIAGLGAGFIDQEGFQCMVDILLKLRHRGLIFGEVPIVLRYDRKAGSSKMNVGRTALQTLRLLWLRRLGH